MLGVGWLRIYLSILFDFIKIKLSFENNRRMIELKGIIEKKLNYNSSMLLRYRRILKRPYVA
jgi:hypothetical protein